MESHVKVLGHALHQMLIPFPLGLLGMAVIFDLIHVFGGGASWSQAAFYMISAGIVTGLAAGLAGFIDWSAIPANTRAKRIGAMHGTGNLVLLVIFAIVWLIRHNAQRDPNAASIVLELAAIALAGFTAWLGGELVDRLGVGIDPGANLDAPNSLSGEPATVTNTESLRRRRA